MSFTSSLPIPAPQIRHWRDNALDLIVRFRRLQQLPGGREAMTRAQIIEFDLIGGALADVRTAFAMLDGVINGN
jgi:hypothetical protein